MRTAAKRDIAEPPIVEALERAGATVVKLSAKDIADLLVGYQGVNYLIEIKTGKAKLRKGQAEFSETWEGQYAVARTPEQALEIIGARVSV